MKIAHNEGETVLPTVSRDVVDFLVLDLLTGRVKLREPAAWDRLRTDEKVGNIVHGALTVANSGEMTEEESEHFLQGAEFVLRALEETVKSKDADQELLERLGLTGRVTPAA